MNNEYLIVLDLDGTLLTKTKKIPLTCKRYIRKLVSKGYKVAIASGRPARNVRKFYDELKLNTPIISLNGLHINYPDNPKRDRRIFFNKALIKNICDTINKKFPINNVIFETDKVIYITNKDAWLETDFWLTNMQVVYGKLEDNIKQNIMTFIIELKDKNYDQNALLKLFKPYLDFGVRLWQGKYRGFIEIHELKSNKYLAIMDVAKELKIKKENIYAFGDDLNDIDMIKNLPHAYAMKNAQPEILKIAKCYTKYDNNHQGVKRELKIILKHLK